MINRHLLDEWMEWRTLGNEACKKILKILNVEGNIRIWPHHFDTGIYVAANLNLNIGFGFAMEDELVNAGFKLKEDAKPVLRGFGVRHAIKQA